jgi:hypothetical protein
MSHANKRLFALAALAGVALAGCSLDQADPNFPESAQPTTFNALYDPFKASLPWPTDLLFFPTGPSDGTINTDTTDTASLAGQLLSTLGKPPFTTQGAALGKLDGFSTSAPIGTSFNQPIDAGSLGPASVIVLELTMSQPNIPSGVVGPLTYGVDYTASVSDDIDSYGKVLRITPLKPLKASTGPIVTGGVSNTVGYLVLLTSSIRDTTGQFAAADQTYQSFKDAPADCSTFTSVTQQLCQLTKAQLGIAQAVGLDPASVVLSWTFTTQSVDDVFQVIAAGVAQAPQLPILVGPTGQTTADVLPPYPGLADIWKGVTVLPYYLTAAPDPLVQNYDADKVILSNTWVAAGPSPICQNPAIPFDCDSRVLTRYNPIPLLTGTVTVPVLVTVPNARANAAAGGCPKPPTGWPVAIFQHGTPRDRTDALLIADALAQGCFIMVAIDLPLHGIVDPNNGLVSNAASALLYDPDHERTFNVDLYNNLTGAAGPDGKTDQSGKSWLTTNFLVTRDNLRQSSADVMMLAKTVSGLDVTGDGQPDVDPARIHLVSLSLGGIAAIPAAKFSPALRTLSVADSGGVLTQLVRDSPTQWPRFEPLLVGFGLTPNSVIFNNTWNRDIQTIIDAADPINHIVGAQAAHPMTMSKVIGDVNVPNSAFDRLTAADGFSQVGSAGCFSVAPGAGKYVAIQRDKGGHGSLIYPYPELGGTQATLELQSQVVQFALSSAFPAYPPCATSPDAGPPYLVVQDTSVIEPVQ